MVRGWPIDLSYSKNSASPNFHSEPLKFCSSSLLIKVRWIYIIWVLSCFVLPRKVDGFHGKRMKHQRKCLRSFLLAVVLASRFNQSSISVYRPGGSLKKWTWLCQVLETWQLWQRDWQIRNSCFVADLILLCMLHVPSTLLPNYFEIFLKCTENIRPIQQSHSSNWRSKRNYMMHRGFRRTDRRRISS